MSEPASERPARRGPASEPSARREPAGSVLSALDAAVERFGRSAVTDPVALAGALRSATNPPPEPVVAVLVQAVSTGAVGALSDALGRDAEPADALAAAVAVAGPGTDPAEQALARWACTLLGAALGLLPRDWALRAGPLPVVAAPVVAAPVVAASVAPSDPTVDVPPDQLAAVLSGRLSGSSSSRTGDLPAGAELSGPTEEVSPAQVRAARADTGPGTAPRGTEELLPRSVVLEPPPTTRPGRRRGVILAVLLAVVVLAAAGGLYAVLGGGSPAGAASAVADLPPAPAPSTSAAPATEPPATSAPAATEDPGPPADPRQAFADPGLLALAEPYISAPGVVCVGGNPEVNQQESVTCDLGNGYIGLFSRMLTPDLLRDLRAGFLQGLTAAPGSTRSLRWEYVAGRPGVKTGIRAGGPNRGEGVRVRFIDEDGSTPRLYFDQDSTASSGYIASVDPARDLDDLRSYWAAPAGSGR